MIMMNTTNNKEASMKTSKKEHIARMNAIREANRAIVATGKCPDCGSPLYRNNALAGWFQCACYPCEDFRKPEYKGMPSCGFQCFTE